MCELFLISNIRLLASVKVISEIKGTSEKLKGKEEKYHPPLNYSYQLKQQILKPSFVWSECTLFLANSESISLVASVCLYPTEE